MVADLRKCGLCKRALPLAAYTVSQEICAACMSLAEQSIGIVREAKKKVGKDVLADCDTRRLANVKPEVKFCPKCQANRPVGDFHLDSSRSDGLCTRCKICDRPAHLEHSRSIGRDNPQYYRTNSLTYKRVKQRGIPVSEATRTYGVSFAEIVEGIKSGEYVSRCVNGRRLVLKADQLELRSRDEIPKAARKSKTIRNPKLTETLANLAPEEKETRTKQLLAARDAAWSRKTEEEKTAIIQKRVASRAKNKETMHG